MKSIILKAITLFIVAVCLFSIIMIDNNSLFYGSISIVCCAWITLIYLANKEKFNNL